MKRATKIWLLAAAGLVVLGMLGFVCVMALNHWDFGALGSSNFKTDTVSISERFENITVCSDTAEIRFLPSDDGKCRVDFYDDETMRSHSAAVKDGTLTIETADMRNWYDRIGFTYGTPQITVCLPQTQYAALVIDEHTGNIVIPGDFAFQCIDITASTGDVACFASASGPVRVLIDTGDIRVENLSAGALELGVSTGRVDVCSVACKGDMRLTVSTGKAFLTDLTCRSFASVGSTGDISMENVTAEGLISVERSTGDVKLAQCDAAELLFKTDTGDVTGSLRSEKVFIAQSETGRIEVPETTSGGKCKITTDTGKIAITVS